MRKTVAIDFDGTLVENDFPNVGPFKPGAKEALLRLRQAGYRILLHSCRISADMPRKREYQSSMVLAMQAEGIPFDDVWDGEGKPVAHAYIDDRGIRFEDNWLEITAILISDMNDMKAEREKKKHENEA